MNQIIKPNPQEKDKDKQVGFSSSLLNSNWARDDSIKSTINSRLSGTSGLVNSAINSVTSASVFNSLPLVTQWGGLWQVDFPGGWSGNHWTQTKQPYSTLHNYENGELSMTSAEVKSTGYSVDLSAFSGKTPPAKYHKLNIKSF